MSERVISGNEIIARMRIHERKVEEARSRVIEAAKAWNQLFRGKQGEKFYAACLRLGLDVSDLNRLENEGDLESGPQLG